MQPFEDFQFPIRGKSRKTTCHYSEVPVVEHQGKSEEIAELMTSDFRSMLWYLPKRLCWKYSLRVYIYCAENIFHVVSSPPHFSYRDHREASAARQWRDEVLNGCVIVDSDIPRPSLVTSCESYHIWIPVH